MYCCKKSDSFWVKGDISTDRPYYLIEIDWNSHNAIAAVGGGMRDDHYAAWHTKVYPMRSQFKSRAGTVNTLQLKEKEYKQHWYRVEKLKWQWIVVVDLNLNGMNRKYPYATEVNHDFFINWSFDGVFLSSSIKLCKYVPYKTNVSMLSLKSASFRGKFRIWISQGEEWTESKKCPDEQQNVCPP